MANVDIVLWTEYRVAADKSDGNLGYREWLELQLIASQERERMMREGLLNITYQTVEDEPKRENYPETELAWVQDMTGYRLGQIARAALKESER